MAIISEREIPQVANDNVPSMVCIRDKEVDFARHIITDNKGRTRELNSKVFTILKCLFAANGCVLTRDQIMTESHKDIFVNDRNIDVQICKLHKILELDPKNPKFIITVPGYGYKLQLPSFV